MTFLSLGLSAQNKIEQIDKRMQDSLAMELHGLYMMDQYIRTPENIHIYTVIGQKYDSMIFDRLIDFIRINGYPTSELVGTYNYTFDSVKAAAVVIMLHSPAKIVEEENYNLLVNEVNTGRLDAEVLSICLDKYYVNYEKRSLYNSPFKQWLDIKGVNIKDKYISDSLRMEIGLDRLKIEEFIVTE